MIQLELWPRVAVSAAELAVVVGEIRNLYWFIRNSRRGVHDARRRRIYRKIEAQKKRLLVAGVSKREVLDFLACCRSKQCCEKDCLGCTKHRPDVAN
ncbi:hypothetical protein [Paraburkholderia flava]|uniref:hypothetical protein n=1 Tax=Paraburkholderia flava TaxID=2547393 RepID=UPI001F108258|nr:hypothetical protein [Paraburkholderia flava]